MANIKKCGQLQHKIREAKEINIMLSELNALQSDFSQYLDMGSDAPDPNSVMARITDIASGCNIRIETAAINKPITEKGYTLLPCKIAFSAPYRTFRLFLSRLETDKKFFRVYGLAVTAVKVTRKRPVKTGTALSQEEAAGVTDEVLKRSKHGGMWVSVNMDIAGFYAE
jgi:hypothetical protein